MRFDAVLFDCDGVLVDSEPITNGVLRDMLEELGWKLTPAECMRIFVGKAVKDEAARIEAHTGQPLTDAWLLRFRERRNQALLARLQPISGAVEAAAAAHRRFAGRIACASGADRFKVELQLAKCGLMPYFEGRIFSGHELPRSKPAPDVYLAAAAALGVASLRAPLLAQDWASAVQLQSITPLVEQDWVRLTQSQFAPVEITPSFWIVPSWHQAPPQAEQIIRLDPGLAFGTGTHPTTRMCLRWTARQAPALAAGWGRVLDYGCGSGILAIGAALHGARGVELRQAHAVAARAVGQGHHAHAGRAAGQHQFVGVRPEGLKHGEGFRHRLHDVLVVTHFGLPLSKSVAPRRPA